MLLYESVTPQKVGATLMRDLTHQSARDRPSYGLWVGFAVAMRIGECCRLPPATPYAALGCAVAATLPVFALLLL